ncbi:MULTISPECIES: lipoprotein-releasing ABC transporter ATP-binding protein LolD [Idiomarina]|jgi:lipoprotein-releasing system ATP-binding protein|uniref:lipoprotein-releasing ABC transporter ATP-binding protein LolD n=1 Tax=Idiomarina TaxID=135575 RepID=UPI000C092248|nr:MULTISPECIES: lipoprotein-releasing ABC transporter ATP-binding protein LolD [Idiomarina]MAL82909.1 lipoprotein-releasing system ATP-binding protein LolD [Idiomarina sp.]MAO67809.1 lipoprotein-releasing system ATP-binding protein LolD [Idiomarina sp.]MBF79318.1 lipoprotein-releasing system ATP-binding protein LolD [Idiomarina sp.]|tara:strand:- start:512 stop:1198 length:687 start_codon:yes stop_codon:yes gene_type:complete
MTDALLRCSKLSKSYQDGNNEVTVLKDIDFSLQAGEMVAVVGTSGSGKSTLLHLLGGLDKASGGQLFYKTDEMTHWKADKLAQWRNQNLGFVYQFHHLLPEFSALENVAMPQMIAGKSPAEAKRQAKQLLTRVGLEHRLSHRPAQLSGGERQRVAIARAFVNKPQIVLADEPTGNLDGEAAESIYQLMLELNKETNTAFIVVTHDLHLAKQLQRVEVLKNGVLHKEED